MLKVVQDLFDYDGWANGRILDFLKSAQSTNRQALRLLAHLLVSEKIWLLRLQGEDTSAVNKSPELSLEECVRLADEMREAFSDYLGSLSEDDLNASLTYKNFAGAEFRTHVREILMHVAQHGTYHRGQIATAVRATGVSPVNTDYINFVRERA